ncbi:MAG: mismatch repair protein MutT [Actinoallomurus sp.]|jgi:8-oxo-dGTP diphosphatase|nr:mismatch repair protein MutT [Actinoallomurus sp.]
MTVLVDKLAWLLVQDHKILSSRNKGKDVWYIPGGKREGAETDEETLIREIREELCVELKPETIKYAGAFEAQAHGKAEGVVVRMTCYWADYEGKIAPGAEIEEVTWLDYSGRELSSAVDKVIFDWLREQGRL